MNTQQEIEKLKQELWAVFQNAIGGCGPCIEAVAKHVYARELAAKRSAARECSEFLTAFNTCEQLQSGEISTDGIALKMFHSKNN